MRPNRDLVNLTTESQSKMYNSYRQNGGLKYRSPLMKQEFTDLLEQHSQFNAKNMVRVLRQLVRHITNEIGDLLLEKGYGDLSARHLHVFENLDASKTNIVILANRAGISKQAMSKLVKEVAELGYVKVITDRNDSRLQVVFITEKGGKFITDLQTEIRSYRDKLVKEQVVSENDLRQTTRVIQQLNSYFEKSSKNNSELVEA
jgi:DNA-binding MarR family transcriptional regulator